ncbi:MAG: hypothetical protein AB1486_10700 [Planctomycetota bacterium]
MAAFKQGAGQRECCKRAFGKPDEWRGEWWDLFHAARELGILKVVPLVSAELGDELQKLYGLESVSVVEADTQTSDGRILFGQRACEFILEKIEELLKLQLSTIDIALAGGATTKLCLDNLPEVLPNTERWFKSARDRIHLWNPTVGLDPGRWEYAAEIQNLSCARILGIPSPNLHLLHGPQYFSTHQEKAQYLQREDVREFEKEARERIVMLVASCGAGPSNYCLTVLERCGQEMPSDFKGEIIFNLYDDRGCPVVYPAPLFTFLPGGDLPARVRAAKRKKQGFISLGVVCGFPDSPTAVKGEALRAALSTDTPWFNHLVCTDDVARELLRPGR